MMGICIRAVDPEAPIPREVVCEYTYDGDHGLFSSSLQSASFANNEAAMRAGWKETYIDDKRCFLGPCCSGKEPRP